ncbi:MAG: DUF5060 domain-containing protein [Anaerolineae bacterium]|nr:DUF5060 domain-containing protein [Anaerolineae bacterium]
MKSYARTILCVTVLGLWWGGCTPAPVETPKATLEATTTPAVVIPTATMPEATPPTVTSTPTRPVTYPDSVNLAILTKPGKAYERIEARLETGGEFPNPYDPAQADWWVTWTAPSGATLRTPAFWYQAFDPQDLTPQGAPEWRARFTPTEPGEWTAQAELTQTGLRSTTMTVTVASDPEARGFVRIHPRSPQHFAYDNGDYFFPVGVNMGWATDDVLADYTRWLDRFSDNGGNLIRVWMASWSFGLEWNDTGLGDYSLRMKQAWLLDKVFELAEERGVTIMLCLINHGAFSARTNPEWDANPYNAALGGPLQAPEDFVTDPLSKALFQRRLRYIAARWSYATSLFAWEWWNEIQWTPISGNDLRPWLAEMTLYLQTLDPYKHLVTHSTATGDPIWSAPELEIVQIHDYSAQNPAWDFLSALQRSQQIAPQKPVMMGEFGYSAGGSTPNERVHLHNGLWATPFLGYTGTGMPWWWENIDQGGEWEEYGPLAAFFAGEDLTTMTPEIVRIPSDGTSALMLQNETRVLGWVLNGKYTARDAGLAYDAAVRKEEDVTNWQYTAPAKEAVSFTVKDLKDGAYTLRWLDPATGNWGKETTVQVNDGDVTVTIDRLENDVAFKLTTK